ncbi:hypothetical protein M3Y99_01496300 [Aphelenchoides fujianensis]|nr:hypothetical protein M3Y99_01496300 [Aphelenchoides fujianensis]
MSQIVETIAKMELDYAASKAKFDAWVRDNEASSTDDSYIEYVRNFRAWEAQMQAQIQSQRDALSRRPVADVPLLPTQNIDDQLNHVLQNVSMNKFVEALIKMVQQDPSLLNLITEVVNRQTGGTGYHNVLLPPPQQQQPMMSGFVPGVPPPQHLAPGSVYQAPAGIPTSFLVTPQARPLGFQPAAYTQPTAHGMIPATWKIDEPVQRLRHPPPPERQILPKLPFKDFSQA